MYLRLTALLLVGGCHDVFGLDVPPDAHEVDAALDAVDARPSSTRWNTPVAEPLTLVYGDDDISLTADRLTLFMNRFEGPDSQIYTATRGSAADPFSTPVIVPVLSVTGQQEGTPRVVPDGLEILYHVDDAVASGELHRATRASTSAEWLPNGPILALNSPMSDQNGAMDQTRTRIVFASNRVGGAGALDLYYSSRPTANDPWSPPDPITKLNTAAIETGAWLTRDGLELYFHRDVGGQQDIYVSRRTSTTAPFELPEPVMEINTPDHEVDAWISPDGQYLYFVRQSTAAMTTTLMYATRQ